MKKVRVSEIFGPTIQGEGPDAGREVYFVRLAGCDFRCVWCDSMYAVDPEMVQKLPLITVEELADQVRDSVPNGSYIVLTGGNPLLYDLEGFFQSLLDSGHHYQFAVETQGSKFQTWLRYVHQVVISPKPPSAEQKYDMDQVVENVFEMSAMGCSIAFKFVIFNKTDVKFAYDTAVRLGTSFIYLSVGTEMYEAVRTTLDRYRSLVPICSDIFLQGQWPVTWNLLPQLHVLIWGQVRGV